MELTEAIASLTKDLERYAESGRATPRSLQYKQLVVNTIIGKFNDLEARIEKTEAALRERVAALEADLRERDRTLAQLHGAAFVDMDWSGLEGRAQNALQYKRGWVQKEEGRSLGPQAAKLENRFLDLLEDEFNAMYDAEVALAMALGRERMAHLQLRQWCAVYGMDLDDWDRIPAEWKLHDLHEAVQVARQRRVMDGLVSPTGIRFPRAYRNPGAVAYSILSAVAFERILREQMLAYGQPVDPERTPCWAWEPYVPNLKKACEAAT